ncbi:MAG: iron ABC transporter permease, partial [SAR86 cluster bacterium]
MVQAKRLQIWLWLLLPVAFVCALALGPQFISPLDFLSTDAGGVSSRIIIEKIRLPRALLAAIIGSTLAVAGVILQGLFRNPLADPSLIGVTSGASAGASLMIVLASGSAGITSVAFGAFTGAVIATIFVYRLASGPNGTSVSTMLLAGIAVSALASAGNSFFEYIADNDMLRQISLWQMGTLSGATWPRLLMAYVILGGLLLWVPRYSTALNAMLLGESEARHLGIKVDVVKFQIIVLVALTVGIAVALSGTIVFVGLVTPHIIRLLIGPDHRYLIPCSALGGAILLLLADAFSRTVFAPSELPIGVVTA